jgi:RimJ/RimL family protein N-acetyltransferase
MIEVNNHEHGHQIGVWAGVRYRHGLDVVFAALDADGAPMGGVIYSGWTGKNGSIAIHVGSNGEARWLSRTFLWLIFDYAFNQLAVRKVIGTVQSTARHTLDFDLRIGFLVEACIEDAYPDGDMIVVGMTRGDCRWLAKKPRSPRGADDGTVQG